MNVLNRNRGSGGVRVHGHQTGLRIQVTQGGTMAEREHRAGQAVDSRPHPRWNFGTDARLPHLRLLRPPHDLANAVEPDPEATEQPGPSIGQVVRNRRLLLGMTQVELAERASALGVPVKQSDISRLEHGKVGLPQCARMQGIAEALGVPLGALLAEAGWEGYDGAEEPWILEGLLSEGASRTTSPEDYEDLVARLEDTIARGETYIAQSRLVSGRAGDDGLSPG
jgi:transcriptional regulator with XRE-family HTH domain